MPLTFLFVKVSCACSRLTRWGRVRCRPKPASPSYVRVVVRRRSDRVVEDDEEFWLPSSAFRLLGQKIPLQFFSALPRTFLSALSAFAAFRVPRCPCGPSPVVIFRMCCCGLHGPGRVHIMPSQRKKKLNDPCQCSTHSHSLWQNCRKETCQAWSWTEKVLPLEFDHLLSDETTVWQTTERQALILNNSRRSSSF